MIGLEWTRSRCLEEFQILVVRKTLGNLCVALVESDQLKAITSCQETCLDVVVVHPPKRVLRRSFRCYVLSRNIFAAASNREARQPVRVAWLPKPFRKLCSVIISNLSFALEPKYQFLCITKSNLLMNSSITPSSLTQLHSMWYAQTRGPRGGKERRERDLETGKWEM